MLLVQAKNLSKSYSVDKPLLDNVDFTISHWQKIALVWRNWVGKSTLLKATLGRLELYDGTIEIRKWIKIWFLWQKVEYDPQTSVIDILLESEDDVVQIIREYEKIVNDPTTNSKHLEEVLQKIENLNAWEYEYKIKIIISKLQITPYLNQKIGTLSGWELRRVALAKILVEEPDLFILDEPTNHLDLEMIEWLEEYLSQQHITLLLVTHDRYFLENVCNEIWELDRGTLFTYQGNYSYFLNKKSSREMHEQFELHKMKRLFKSELEWMRRAPWARRTKSIYRQERFHELNDDYRAKKNLIQETSVQMEVSMEERRLGNKILKTHKLRKSFGDKVILNDFSYEFKFQERLGIIWKNWVGKSKFVQILMWLEGVDSWHLSTGESIKFGYYFQQEVEYPYWKRIIDIVRDTAEFMIDGQGNRISASLMLEKFLFPTHQHFQMADSLSWWEKRRLQLLTILMKQPNFLILDEPTNDLDLITLWVLEEFLLQYQGCLIIISHDRFFMDKIVDHLFIFEWNGQIKDFWWTYSEWKQTVGNDYNRSNPDNSRQATGDREKDLSHSREAGIHENWWTNLSGQKIPLTYDERREFNKLEKEIMKLEERKESINFIFSTSTPPLDEIKSLSEELKNIQKLLEQKEYRRFELSERA